MRTDNNGVAIAAEEPHLKVPTPLFAWQKAVHVTRSDASVVPQPLAPAQTLVVPEQVNDVPPLAVQRAGPRTLTTEQVTPVHVQAPAFTYATKRKTPKRAIAKRAILILIWKV
jgi:hypothetical protein